jgi:hypothetical protein
MQHFPLNTPAAGCISLIISNLSQSLPYLPFKCSSTQMECMHCMMQIVLDKCRITFAHRQVLLFLSTVTTLACALLSCSRRTAQSHSNMHTGYNTNLLRMAAHTCVRHQQPGVPRHSRTASPCCSMHGADQGASPNRTGTQRHVA